MACSDREVWQVSREDTIGGNAVQAESSVSSHGTDRAKCLVLRIARASPGSCFIQSTRVCLDAGKPKAMRSSRRSNVALGANAYDASTSLRWKVTHRLSCLWEGLDHRPTGRFVERKSCNREQVTSTRLFAGPIPLVTVLPAFPRRKSPYFDHANS